MILNELTDILSSYFCILVSHQSFKTPSYSHHSGVTTKTPCSHIQMAPSCTSTHYSTLFDITSYPYFALPSVQFSRSVVSNSLWPPLTAAHQASLSITNTWSLLTVMFIESVMPSNHPILCHPLLLSSVFPSIRVFSRESVFHIRWPKYWSFSFSISPSNEYSGLISFRIDWFDFLAVQGTFKSRL